MKCPVCERQYTTSPDRTECHGTESTLMGTINLDGHEHDSNQKVTRWSCSRGHKWYVSWYKICEICGFNSDKERKVVVTTS